MPKTMPVAIQDKTADFIMQMSQGNQALARLYTQLLARYEEARLGEDFKREMFDKGVAARKDYWDHMQGGNDEERYHPMRGGAPAATNTPPPTTAAPTARPQARPMPMIPGATPIPGGDGFDRSSSAPVAPTSAPAGSVPATPGYDSFAQATGADDQEFSAQSRIGIGQPQPQQRTPRGAARSIAPPAGQLPRGTGMDPQPRKARKPPAQAEFLPIQPEWLQKMRDAETKWNVPHGSVLSVYGFENSGGRFTGRNKYSTAAGIGQFTEELMKEYKVDPAHRNDPNVMIDLIARNLSRGARVLERDFKIKLDPNNPQHVPFYTLMHQFGVSDGPVIIRQYLTNPNVPLTSIMANVKNRDGSPRNNAETLANNLIPSNSTVGKAVEQHASIVQPWYDNGLKLMSSTQPPAKTTTTPPAATATPAPGAEATPATPTPTPTPTPTTPAQQPMSGRTLTGYLKGKPPEHVTGLQPVMQQRLQALFDMAPPEIRSQLGINSGFRTIAHQTRLWNDAIDKYGSAAAARRWVAPPGGSEHNRGNASDLYFGSPAARQWVHANAAKVGLRFPMGHEPWHIEVSETRGGPKFAGTLPQRPVATTQQPATPATAQPPVQQVAMRAPKPSEVFTSPNIKPTIPEPFKAQDVTQTARGGSMFDVPISPALTSENDIFHTSIYNDPNQAPPMTKLASSSGGPPIAPRAGGLAARSALDYVAEPEPSQSITPQASGVAARSDLDYGRAPMERVEAPLMEQPQPAPSLDPLLMEQPQPPPTVGQDIPVGDAVPQASTPFDWPTEGMPQSPDITGPPINMSGGVPNAPPPQDSYPPPEFNQVVENSHNYDPTSRAGRRIDYARRNPTPVEPSYMDQLIRSITDRGSTAPPLPMPPPWNSAVAIPDRPSEAAPEGGVTPPTLDAIKKAIYGSQITGGYKGTARGQRDIREGRLPTTRETPPPEVPPQLPEGNGWTIPTPTRNPHFAPDFNRMRDAIESGNTKDLARNSQPYVTDPNARNSIMDKIKEMAQQYMQDYEKNYYPDRLQRSIQGDAKKVKPTTYGRDWMPKQADAPTKLSGPQDDLPPPVSAPPVIPKPSGSQQPAVMPSMAPKTPPAPAAGSGGAGAATGGPQVMGGAARKAAAAAAAGPGNGYSWINDENVTEYGMNE